MCGNSKLTLQKIHDSKQWLITPVAIGLCFAGLGYPNLALSQTRKPSVPAKPPTKVETVPANKASTRPGLRPILQAGSQGAEVTELQAMLQLLGYYKGAVNGIYDQALAIAVSKFQSAAGLSPDGIVGSDTWSQLLPPSPNVSSTPASVPAATANPIPSTPSAEAFPMPSAVKPNPADPTKKPTDSTNAATKPPSSTSNTERSSGNPETVTLPILRQGMQGLAVAGLQERLRALGFLKSSADGVFGPETHAAVQAAQRKLSLEPDGVVGPATWIGLLR